MIDERLSLWKGKKEPDHLIAWRYYQQGLDYNNQLNLDDTVKANENFYIGKQWEGVQSNGLPTPSINFLKRVVGFIVATTTTDNIKINCTALGNVPDDGNLLEPVDVLHKEFDSLTELNDVPTLLREFARNAAVDGDGCMYSYWDADVDNGQEAKGAIRTEIVDNTRVIFGNPTDKRVQNQPYIIIASRAMCREVMNRAKDNGITEWSQIRPDTDESNAVDGVKHTDGMVTLLLTMWRDEESGEIMAMESTLTAEVKKPWSLGIRRYPVCWLPWDAVKDSYHGQAMITGLIPNQVAVNKLWAMTVLSSIKMGFPKYIYDGTRIAKLDNRVGSAIKVNGGDVNTVIRSIDPAPVSPQITQLMQLLVEQTEQSLGATAVALGDTRPDNTSAIIALQRAASTPTELSKLALHRCIEDLFRIYLEFIAEYYGKRYVNTEPPKEVVEAAQFAGMPLPNTVPMQFDFNIFKKFPMKLKIDVGTSSYYSEIEAMNTLNGLLQGGFISLKQFLERIPDEYVPNRRGLIDECVQQEKQAQMMQQAQMQQAAPPAEEAAPLIPEEEEVQGGKGNRNLQREIAASANV